MKLINHKNGNYYECAGGIMRGTISMTIDEYKQSMRFLASERKRAIKKCDTAIRDGLAFVKGFAYVYSHPSEPISLGVTATKLITKHFGLKNYKDQNYAIKVI